MMSPRSGNSRFNPLKVCLRAAVDFILRMDGTTLPAYFSLRDRLSYLRHGLEPSLVKISADILQPGDTVVDIGANVGFLTRAFSTHVGPNGRVFAFEPDPATFACLSRNTERFTQVTALQLALSDQTGRRILHLHPVSGMSNSLVNQWEGANTVEVRTSTFDGWAREVDVGSIKLVKIDVEGAELLVLRGMCDALRALNSPHIILEFCPANLGSSEVERDIFEFFFERGYALYLLNADASLNRVNTPEQVRCLLNRNGYANLLGRREHLS
jgi:FkbM family methyltransferase